MYRCFFPLYSLWLTAFYVMMMYEVFSNPLLISGAQSPAAGRGGALVKGSWVPTWVFVSSAVVFHSFLMALERFANYWLTRRTQSPLQTRDAKEFPRESKRASSPHKVLAAGPAAGMSPAAPILRAARLLAPPFTAEGMPLWGFGFIEWWILFVALAAFFLAQVRAMHPHFVWCFNYQHMPPISLCPTFTVCAPTHNGPVLHFNFSML